MPVEPCHCPTCGKFYLVAYHWDVFRCSMCGALAERGEELHGYRSWEAKPSVARAEITNKFVECVGER